MGHVQRYGPELMKIITLYTSDDISPDLTEHSTL